MTQPDPLPTDPTAPKEWWTSKTLWTNLISLIVLAVGLILESAGALHLDPQLVIWIGIGLAVLNAVLRLVTNSAVTGTPAAAVAVKAKEDIALHAALAAPVPTPQPVQVQPTLDDLPALLAELKQRHDKDGALLAQLAGTAGGSVVPPVGAWTGAPLSPPAVTTP